MRTFDRGRLHPATKLAYGVGALSDSIKTFSFTTFLLFYYTTVLGLPGTLLGLAMSVGLVWDASVDPLIGHLSDRSTARVGRRHGFMMAGALCAGASFIAVFNPPSGLSNGQLFVWVLASSLFVRSSISLFKIPYSALGAELAPDYDERTSISAYRSAAVLAGTLLCMAAAFLYFLPNDTASGGADAKFARDSYGVMGIAFGAAITVFGLVATFGTLRARHCFTASAGTHTDSLPVGRAVFATLSDTAFRVLVVSSALSVMAAAINAALAMHFLTYHARISGSGAVTLCFSAFYAGALAGVAAWTRAAQWFEKYQVLTATTLVTALVMSAGYWLVGDGRPFGTGNLNVLMAGNALVGFFSIAGSMMVPSMLADVTARDELLTGRRREGVFFGVHSFGLQLSGGLAVLVAAVLVDRFANLVPGQTEQSAATVEHLALIATVLPAVILACAGIVAARYSLTRGEVESIQRQLTAVAEPPQVGVYR